MIGEWITPLLEWSGLAIVPFLLLVFFIVYLIKG